MTCNFAVGNGIGRITLNTYTPIPLSESSVPIYEMIPPEDPDLFPPPTYVPVGELPDRDDPDFSGPFYGEGTGLATMVGAAYPIYGGFANNAIWLSEPTQLGNDTGYEVWWRFRWGQTPSVLSTYQIVSFTHEYGSADRYGHGPFSENPFDYRWYNYNFKLEGAGWVPQISELEEKATISSSVDGTIWEIKFLEGGAIQTAQITLTAAIGPSNYVEQITQFLFPEVWYFAVLRMEPQPAGAKWALMNGEYHVFIPGEEFTFCGEYAIPDEALWKDPGAGDVHDGCGGGRAKFTLWQEDETRPGWLLRAPIPYATAPYRLRIDQAAVFTGQGGITEWWSEWDIITIKSDSLLPDNFIVSKADPLWGWYTELATVNANGVFSTSYQPVRGYFAVWVDGDRLTSNQDWELIGGTTSSTETSFQYQLSDFYRALHGIPAVVTLTYLMAVPGIPHSWKTPIHNVRTDDPVVDGEYPPHVRGID